MAGMGGGAAYQMLRVPEDDIGENARNFANISAQNMRQQKQLNADKEAAQAKARDEAYTATDLGDEDFKVVVTGLDNLDDINRDFANTGVSEYQKAGYEAREAFDRGDKKAYQLLLNKQKKIKTSFENHSNDQTLMAELNKTYMKLDSEGKISPVDSEWEKVMDAANSNNYRYVYDADGNVNIQFLLKDENGDDSVKVIKKSDLINGNYRPYEKVEVNGKGGLIDEMLVGFGKRVYDEQSGNYITTTQVWDDKNEAGLQAKLEAVTSDKRSMSSLLYQASGGTIKKKGDTEKFGEEDAYTDEDYKMVKDFVTSQVKAQYDTEESIAQDSTNLSWEQLRQRKKEHEDSKNQPKTKTAEEEELSIRKFDIQQAIENNDVESFSSGDFKWEGEDYSASSATTVGDKVVITTTSGKKIVVSKDERALNDLYNAFEGKSLGYDKVMVIEANPYRSTRAGSESGITDLLEGQYSTEGEFIGDDDDFTKGLKKIFPSAKITTPMSFREVIEINGEKVDLTKPKAEVEARIRQLVKIGENKKGASNSPAKEDPLGIL